ncbi:hypothetical protein CBP52_16845 [Cellulomonas sp. PSBB021]|nr:hypothetical protein CBP52_16845 [Cellulomonas sp. PSBB021]
MGRAVGRSVAGARRSARGVEHERGGDRGRRRARAGGRGVALAASITAREPVESTLARLVTTSGAVVVAAVVLYAVVWRVSRRTADASRVGAG